MPRRTAVALTVALVGVALLKGGFVAFSGTNLLLDDWSILNHGRLFGAFDALDPAFRESRPGAWLALVLLYGVCGPHPLALLTVVTVVNALTVVLLYLVLARFLSPPGPFLVAVLWLLLPTHTSLTVWGPTIQTLVALCLLLLGVLLLSDMRSMWIQMAAAAACLAAAPLFYEMTVPACFAAALFVPSSPRLNWRHRSAMVALIAIPTLWMAAHPLYPLSPHVPALAQTWDALFGTGLFGTLALPEIIRALPALLALVGAGFCAVSWCRGNRGVAAGPAMVLVGLIVIGLGLTAPLTLDLGRAPLGNLDRVYALSSIGSALVLFGIARHAWSTSKLLTTPPVLALGVVLLVGQVVTLGSWSQAGDDGLALLDYIDALAPDAASRDFVVGPTPVVRNGVFSLGVFAQDAFALRHPSGTGSLTGLESSDAFTTAGYGTFIDWFDPTSSDPPESGRFVPGSPIGVLEDVTSPRPGQIEVRGWAADESAGRTPVDLQIRIDSRVVEIGPAALDHPDVAATHPWAGSQHGFRSDIPASGGFHLVCGIAGNIGPGADRPLASAPGGGRATSYCQRVRVDSDPNDVRGDSTRPCEPRAEPTTGGSTPAASPGTHVRALIDEFVRQESLAGSPGSQRHRIVCDELLANGLSVPFAWRDIRREPGLVAASPDLAGRIETMPVVVFSAARFSGGRPRLEDLLAGDAAGSLESGTRDPREGRSVADGCTPRPPIPYADGVYTGLAQVWVNCDGDDGRAWLLVGALPDDGAKYRVDFIAQALTRRDAEALGHALETIQVDFSRLPDP